MTLSLTKVLVVTGCAMLHVGCAASSTGAVACLDEINSPQVEYGATVDPETGDILFVRTDAPWGQSGQSSLWRASSRDGGCEVEPLDIDGVRSPSDPFVSADGQWLYFTAVATATGDDDIWRASRQGDTWVDAKPVEGVNSPAAEYSPVIAPDGTLYFASSREGGFGQGDLWMAAPLGTGFAAPRNMGPGLNSPSGEWNLGFSPDGRTLVFEVSGRDTNLSNSGDLYVSHRPGTGWTAPIALRGLNTEGSELMPRFTPDGTTFLYASSKARNGRETDVLAVATSALLTNSDHSMLAVVSRSAHEIAFVDLERGEVVDRHRTGMGPHEIAVSPDGQRAFVPAYGSFPVPHEEPIEPNQLQWAEAESGEVSVWDPSGEDRTQSICPESHGVATTPDDGHVWVTCEASSEILELDASAREVLQRWNSGGAGTHQLATEASGRFVVAANTESANISILDRQSGDVRVVETDNGAEGLSIADDGLHVWVGNTQANTISLVRIADGTLVRSFPSGGRFPVKLSAVPGSDELWVVNTFSRSIAIFSEGREEPLDVLQFDTPPLGIMAAQDGARMVVSFPRRNEIVVFDRATRQELKRIGGIMEADGMAWMTIGHLFPKGEN